MLNKAVLRSLAEARLEDARVLFDNARYDGAGYLCGDAVELVLKARICDTLDWSGYPDTKKEWENLSSFKTHDLHILLRLSGRVNLITQNTAHFATWSLVTTKWKPEMRYRAIGTTSLGEAQTMIEATDILLPLL